MGFCLLGANLKKNLSLIQAHLMGLMMGQTESNPWRNDICKGSTNLLRDSSIGKHIVPIVPDEARTFGMDGLFRQFGIYSSVGQKYEPEDSDQVMFYKESEQGVLLEEGINEAGAFSAWLALATSYANNNLPMIPFYIYYSMFGFQRIHDLAWAAGDSRAKGFLLGAHPEEPL